MSEQGGQEGWACSLPEGHVFLSDRGVVWAGGGLTFNPQMRGMQMQKGPCLQRAHSNLGKQTNQRRTTTRW